MKTLKPIYQRVVPFRLRDWMHRKRRELQWGWDHQRERWEYKRQFKEEWPYRFGPAGMFNRLAIGRFANRHRGERCFIIGNGPSLKGMDLSPLRDEITFGLNRFYLHYPEIGFHSTYYVSVNALVLEQFAHEIQPLPMPKFVTWESRQHFQQNWNMMFLFKRHDRAFSDDPGEFIVEQATVTFVALQLAFYMGFRTVYLIGVDHNFATVGPANQTVVSEGADPNHFHPDYFGKGVKWQLPDLEASERVFEISRQRYQSAGRQVLDATVNGKLQIFPKMDYSQLFNL